jgi:hypothetical protein
MQSAVVVAFPRDRLKSHVNTNKGGDRLPEKMIPEQLKENKKQK